MAQKAATFTGTTLRFTGPAPAAVNAIGTQLRDPINSGLRACINVLIESVHKIRGQNLSKIKLCDWPNKLDATTWQVLNTTESVGMDRF